MCDNHYQLSPRCPSIPRRFHLHCIFPQADIIFWRFLPHPRFCHRPFRFVARFFLLPYRFPFWRVPPGLPVSVSRIEPQPRCPSQTLRHTCQISSFVSPESGCFMPKGHKDLFEVNSRDNCAGFCELGDKTAHPCEPHLIDRAFCEEAV
jgi:hypothetical protein